MNHEVQKMPNVVSVSVINSTKFELKMIRFFMVRLVRVRVRLVLFEQDEMDLLLLGVTLSLADQHDTFCKVWIDLHFI